ncbi:PqqD family protein [Solirubrobacter soli]|uniref:PqqD family protein n=1 Tax=Solirubrobacter soli TaxID=363832 RepID=UPI00040D53B3|nr:PqqD family protein [Solirubrobacter soli]
MTELKLRGEGVAWTDVDGEIVALDEAAAVYLAANEAGGMLWRALADGATQESLSAALAAEYGIDAARAEADTEAFLAALRERGLLEGAPAA